MQTQNLQLWLTGTIRKNASLIAIGLLVFLLIYLSTFIKGYGYFIDELYYLACASHPAFGYVDHPPLAPLVLTVVQAILGNSLPVIRLIPALAAASTVVLTGVIAREMGGGKVATVIAAVAMASSPTVLAFGGFYSMNPFEPPLAAAVLVVTLRMVRENNPRRWMMLGVIFGLGIMNKHTFGAFIIALVTSLAVTGYVRLLLNRWFLLAALISTLIVLPNFIWQAANGFPSLEFYSNISRYKNVHTPPLAFVMGQVMGMSPFAVPVWLGGTVFLLLSARAKGFRFLAIIFLGLFLFMMLSGTSRSDRLLFAYPPVLAGGALMVEYFIDRFHARWLKIAAPLFLSGGIVMGVPLVLPYFTYEENAAYVRFIDFNTELERGNKPALSQLLADRIGWEEKVDLVEKAFGTLSPEEQRSTVIAAGNYGQAGAIELFGKDLAPVVCGHNTYYLWSRERLHDVTTVLYLAHEGDSLRLAERFNSVEPCDGVFENPYVTGHENHLKVFICRKPNIPLLEMLEKGKSYS